MLQSTDVSCNNKKEIIKEKDFYSDLKKNYDEDLEFKNIADSLSAYVREVLAKSKITVKWEKQVLLYILQIAHNIRYGIKEWTVLWGGVGTGKTTIANAIIDYYSNNGYFGLCRRVKAQDVTISYSNQDRYNEIRNADVLLIDEVGKETKKAAYNAGTPMCELIDYRYEHHLTTIITTNLSPCEMLKHFDDSTMDRIDERSLIINIKRDRSFRKDLK